MTYMLFRKIIDLSKKTASALFAILFVVWFIEINYWGFNKINIMFKYNLPKTTAEMLYFKKMLDNDFKDKNIIYDGWGVEIKIQNYDDKIYLISCGPDRQSDFSGNFNEHGDDICIEYKKGENDSNFYNRLVSIYSKYRIDRYY